MHQQWGTGREKLGTVTHTVVDTDMGGYREQGLKSKKAHP